MSSRREIKDSHGDDEEDEREEQDEADEDDEEEEEEQRLARRRKSGKPSGRTRWQRAKAWFRDARLYLYAAFFVGAVVLVLLGFLSIWAPKQFGTGLENWFKSMGPYNAYLFFAGLVCIATAGYLFLSLITKRSEFKRLVSTKSKADFVHSLDHIERLAFELGTHENEIVAARKREFKIRH